MILSIYIQSHAQLENITLSKEVTVDRLYTGLFTNTSLTNHSSGQQNTASFRLGTRVHVVLIPEVFQIRSFGVLDKGEGKAAQILRSYEAIFTPTKKFALQFGVMATPTTEIRPNPTTWQSQVETQAEKTIIGGRPGMKLHYDFGKDFRITYGIHSQDNHPSHHLKIRYKRLILSSFMQNNAVFLVAKWKFTGGNILVTRFREQTSFSTMIPIDSRYVFYTDLAYEESLQKRTYLELGMRRHFPKDGRFRGFLSIQYNDQLQSVLGGLFIHI